MDMKYKVNENLVSLKKDELHDIINYSKAIHTSGPYRLPSGNCSDFF